jgi:hypothetical protein
MTDDFSLLGSVPTLTYSMANNVIINNDEEKFRNPLKLVMMN